MTMVDFNWPVTKLMCKHIRRDEDIQRPLCESHVAKIVREWEEHMYDPIKVNFRSDECGEYGYVWDGGHRLAAVIRRGHDFITAHTTNFSREEEARWFVRMNLKSRKQIDPYRVYVVGLNSRNGAEYEKALAMYRVATSNGKCVRPNKTKKAIPAGSLASLIGGYGEDIAFSVVYTLTQAFPTDNEQFNSAFMT